MKLTRVIKILIIASDIIIIIAFMKWRWLNMVNELSQNDQHKIFDQVMSALNENYYNQSGHPMLAGTTQAEDTFNPGNEIGRAHVLTPVTFRSRMPSSA